jgi:hypothetical protein
MVFENGDPLRPLVIGMIRAAKTSEPTPSTPIHARIDGDSLTLTAEREVVLRCGAASLTLTRAGKVLIQGAYISSRSSGVNKIKGGSIQLN